MSNQFDWQFEEDGALPEPPEPRPRRGAPWGVLALLLACGLLIGVAGVAYRAQQREAALRAEVQAVVDFERAAFLDGDGELFFSVQSAEPAWLAAQLHPINQRAYAAGLTITHAEAHDDRVWANASWTDEAGERQRVLFFQREPGGLRHTATDPAFWSEMESFSAEWGVLRLSAVDQPWRTEITSFVSQTLWDACGGPCGPGAAPLIVTVGSTLSATAASNQVAVPSPRLVGLTPDGAPSTLFWDMLARELTSLTGPVTVRFGVPPQREQRVAYEPVVRDFHDAQSAVTIDLVELTQWPPDTDTLATLDGAAFMPTETMLAAGLVQSLDAFVASDVTLDSADFYAVMWHGARWQGRLWALPQGAIMRTLFYDTAAYTDAGLSPPSLRWTWDELQLDTETVVAAQAQASWIEVAYLDTTLDTLIAYAANHEPACVASAQPSCLAPLSAEAVDAAFAWYTANTADPAHMAELSPLSAEERAAIPLNWQSARRKAAIWVEEPLFYFHQFQLQPLGVTTFPGTDQFDGTTPLWLHGNIILQTSTHPRAVWSWLRFLSDAPTTRGLIPAQPSVAHAIGFWDRLPRDVGEALRAAFPLARAVRIEERGVFTWDAVEKWRKGADSAEIRPQLTWFNP